MTEISGQYDPTLDPMATLRQPNPEVQNPQVEAAVKFALYLTGKYPQVDLARTPLVEQNDGTTIELPALPDSVVSEPVLNYYLAGSLATALLSRADSIELAEATTGSNITITRVVNNTPESRAAFARFARPIGDIDFVQTANYIAHKRTLQQSVPTSEQANERSKYLWKGGGGPTFDEVPANASLALQRSEGQFKIMCDPLETAGPLRFARIAVDGNFIYVARPDTIIGYKTLHMLQSFNQKPERFNEDFTLLHTALGELLTEEEMVESTHTILSEFEAGRVSQAERSSSSYEPGLPGFTDTLMSNDALSGDARSFMDKVIEYDQSRGQVLGVGTSNLIV
jgi:hypothetical protein